MKRGSISYLTFLMRSFASIKKYRGSGMSNEEARSKGKVKWFNSSKGYGFIVTDDGREFFAHFSAIEMDGYKTLTENQEVSFVIQNGPKGLQAAQIRDVVTPAA